MATSDLDAGAQSWRVKRPLAPGRYWWLVESVDAEGAEQPSAPSRFSIPLRLQVLSIAPRAAGARVAVHWTGNARRVTVVLYAVAGSRVVWTGRRRESDFTLGRLVETVFAVLPPYARSTFRVNLSARI